VPEFDKVRSFSRPTNPSQPKGIEDPNPPVSGSVPGCSGLRTHPSRKALKTVRVTSNVSLPEAGLRTHPSRKALKTCRLIILSHPSIPTPTNPSQPKGIEDHCSITKVSSKETGLRTHPSRKALKTRGLPGPFFETSLAYEPIPAERH